LFSLTFSTHASATLNADVVARLATEQHDCRDFIKQTIKQLLILTFFFVTA